MFVVNRRFPFLRKLIIAFFTVPLMFAGGSLLGGLAQSQNIGEVGSLEIPRSEFVGRYQNAAEEYRRVSGNEELPPSVAQRIDSEVRSELLSYYLMQEAIAQKGIYAPDSSVVAEIRQTPDFQDEDGNYAPEKYKEFVSDFRYYQERVRESVGREPIFRAMNALPQQQIRTKIAAFRQQERIVDEAILPFTTVSTIITLAVPIDDINLYYQRNSDQYRVREEADFQYFVFSLDDFAVSVEVEEEEIELAYEEFVAESETLARRQISHIYIEDETLAQEVAQQAMERPENFSDLAIEYSEDFGSAEAGGSLGIVALDDLPIELNDVVFAMTVGEVHAPVETEEGGFSILKLEALISETVLPLAEIRNEITQRARREVARADFETAVEELRDQAVVEIGALNALANTVGVSVTAALTVYSNAAENTYPFNEEGILLEVFDELVIASGENSAPIPISDDDYLFVRTTRYQAEGVRPLAEVENEITDIIRSSYLASDLYRQIETADVFSTVSAAPNFDELFSEIPSVTELLEEVEWIETHELVLADIDNESGGANSVDGSVEIALEEEATEAKVSNIAIDRIYAADVSRGLPAYVFLPQKEGLRIYRVREINEREPLESDYLVIDELLEDMSGRLTAVGYLDALSGQYQYQFYNVPSTTEQQ